MANRLVQRLRVLACAVSVSACGFPPPPGLRSDAGGPGDASTNNDGDSQPDINPSNGLAPYLDMTAGAIDVNLGTTATINTDDGTVVIDGSPVVMQSATVAQTAAPTIRVFIVHSLTAHDVAVTGKNALAIVGDGAVEIGGLFSASASADVAGPGGFNDATCLGHDGVFAARAEISGAGGGAFGGFGGNGGDVTDGANTVVGGMGGFTTGNAELVPLRGGCDSGHWFTTSFHGSGGGALQLVSRTRITISGGVATNGSRHFGAGSGGGILLEAPQVNVTGSVVANGAGADSGCGMAMGSTLGNDGRLDATPAAGGACDTPADGGAGGSGGARNATPRNGMSITAVSQSGSAGSGGGGVGRIRVNAPAGGLIATGVFSPNPSTGTLATR